MRTPPEPTLGPGDGVDFANRFDKELAGVFERREPTGATGLIGFERYTDRITDSVFVLANPSADEVTEWVQLPNSKLMNPLWMLDLLGDADLRLTNGMIRVTLPADGFLVLDPEIHPEGGYSSYKRVQ